MSTRIGVVFKQPFQTRPIPLRPKVTTVRKGKRRCGGTWRAFLHKSASGPFTAEHSRDLSRIYWEEKKYEDPNLIKLGQLAADAGQSRESKYGENSFGVTKRALARKRSKSSALALWQRAMNKSGLVRARLLAEHADLSAGNLHESIKVANKLKKLDGQYEQDTFNADIKVLEEFQSSVGVEHLRALQTIVPELEEHLKHITVVPCPSGMSFELSLQPMELATQAAAFASVSRQTNLSTCLEKEWSAAHQLAPAASYPQVKGERRVCYENGFCVCSNSKSGKCHQQMRNKVYNMLKQIFPGKDEKGHRARLNDADVVMHFRSTGFVSDMDDSVVIEELWLHIGLMLFSPYQMSAQRMEQIVPLAYDAGETKLYLQAGIETMQPSPRPCNHFKFCFNP
eukprot:1906542-Amphidinium_carterae.2